MSKRHLSDDESKITKKPRLIKRILDDEEEESKDEIILKPRKAKRISDDDECEDNQESKQIELDVMKLSTNRWSQTLEDQVIALAIRSRSIGFNHDSKIITGCIRNLNYRSHNIAVLMFETMRRSLSDTWDEARLEWTSNQAFGFSAWSDGSEYALHYHIEPNDHKAATEPIKGQCTCLRCGIKYRYHIINTITQEQITVGSECVKYFNDELIEQHESSRDDPRIWSVNPTVTSKQSARKWIRC